MIKNTLLRALIVTAFMLVLASILIGCTPRRTHPPLPFCESPDRNFPSASPKDYQHITQYPTT